MKSSIVIACSVGAIAATHDGLHEDRLAQIRNISSTEGVLWTAGVNPRFSSEAPGASKSLCGVKGSWQESIRAAVKRGEVRVFEPAEELQNAAMPDDFDSETNWPQCAKILGDIRDQSNCGCCWAFAAAEAASDRMCIATDGKMQLPLSAEDVCFCASDDGCGGGDIMSPWDYIKNSGAVSGGQYQGTGPFGKGLCSDFSLPHCHHHGPQRDDPYPAEGEPGCPSASSPQCPTTCDAEVSSEHSDFASDKYAFRGEVETASGEMQIQQMIMAGGPVETAFTVYSDFENYVGGIYHHVSGDAAGGHAVKFVGWGVENGVKYWKVANSWNPHWGEKGYFRIKRGNNEGGIEDTVVGASRTSTWGRKSALVSALVV
jgi:cathepsin B